MVGLGGGTVGMSLTTHETQKSLQCSENGLVEQNSNWPFTQLYRAFVSEATSLFAAGTTTSLLSALTGWLDPTFVCTCTHKHIPGQDKHSWLGSGMRGRKTSGLAGRYQV